MLTRKNNNISKSIIFVTKFSRIVLMGIEIKSNNIVEP